MRISDWSSDVCSSDLLVGLRDIIGHRGGVEFDWVMRLQPGRVIGDERIGGSVALVEAIARELVDQVEQFIGLRRADRLFRAAFDETRPLGIHFGLDLLAHRAAQKIGLAKRIARSEEHTSELQSLMRISYAVFC